MWPLTVVVRVCNIQHTIIVYSCSMLMDSSSEHLAVRGGLNNGHYCPIDIGIDSMHIKYTMYITDKKRSVH